MQGREQWVCYMVSRDALDDLCDLAWLGLLTLEGIHGRHVWLLRIDLGAFVPQPYALHEKETCV